MKILYHHRTSSKDGQFVHIEELTSALRAMGHDILVVGPRTLESNKLGADAGFTTLLKKYLPKFIYELFEFSYSFLDYWQLTKAARQYKPDCLYERYNLFLLSGLWLKRKYHLPFLLEVNSPLYEERKKYGGISIDRLARWTQRLTWCGADYVLPVTQVLADQIVKAGVPSSRVIVIPNAINPARFRNVPDTKEAKMLLGLQDRFVLGFVGFMREWHGLEKAIDFVAERKEQNYHLLLVGDGPARGSLEKRAQAYGVSDRVTVTGVVGRNNIGNCIAAFDVALQPHVVEYASPLKLFEYLGLGRPIVAPDTPNIQEILKHEENAILFQPGDFTDFANALQRLCDDGSLRRKIAIGAKNTISRRSFTWQNNASKVSELLSGLISENNGWRS